jgi:hypothetical protein
MVAVDSLLPLLRQALRAAPSLLGSLPPPLPGGPIAGQSPPAALPPATLPVPLATPLPPTPAPVLARVLAQWPVEPRGLGSALAALGAELARARSGGLPGRAPEALAARLGALAQVEGLDGPELARRLAGVGWGPLPPESAVAGGGPAPAPGAQDLAAALTLEAELLRAREELPPGPLREAVARALLAVEGEHLQNLVRREQGEPPLWLLPVPDGAGWAAVWFQERRRRGSSEADPAAGGGATVRLSLGLELSGLGPLRADVALAPGRLWVRLAVARPEVAAALERSAAALVAALEGGGRGVQVLVQRVDEADLAPPAPPSPSHLDVAA